MAYQGKCVWLWVNLVGECVKLCEIVCKSPRCPKSPRDGEVAEGGNGGNGGKEQIWSGIGG